MKQKITIAILATLILIGSGLYFYIEMKITSQNLYVAQNNTGIISTPKKQKPVLPKIKPVTKKEIQQVTKAKKQKAVKPVRRARVTPQPINIIQTKKSDPIHVLLNDAYHAFHAQDYQKSETLYKKALRREPKNRDALLGLAAIGIKQQRYEYSRQKYQYLLKLNPRDSIATAGISSIENSIDPHMNESQLKFLLRQQPDAAHLYFALGGQYMIQKKWAEAQSAYFSAWSAENDNADYAYNLAVSLDHLDKKQQALNFYQLSLKLQQLSPANFSATDARNRANTLQSGEL